MPLSVRRFFPQSAVLTILLCASPAWAATYYISGSGNDLNTGLAENAAFRSIQKAANVTQPGDTVLVMNGTYTNGSASHVLRVTRSGTAAAPITYKAYPYHKPLIQFTTAAAGISVEANYITIDGFEVQGGAASVTLATAQSLAGNLTNPETNSSGIVSGSASMTGVHPHHVTIRNNTVHDCSCNGIVANFGDYITIQNNTTHNNAKWSPNGCSGISLKEAQDTDASTATKNLVLGNISYGNEQFIPTAGAGGITDGHGIIIDDNKNTKSTNIPYNGRTLVANNITYNNGGAGIQSRSSQHVDIVNNVSYMNTHSPAIDAGQIFANGSIDVSIFNNIVHAPNGKAVNTNDNNASVNYDYNIYFGGSTTAVRGPHDIVGDPKFVNASAADFHLLPGSPAIDSGTASKAPSTDQSGKTRGSGVDRGVYEYTATVVVNSGESGQSSGGFAAMAAVGPTDNIQAAVNANPAGTTFILGPGIYRMQSITPKQGNIFDGQGQAVLNGSRLLTGFTQSGSTWRVTGQTQQGSVMNDECRSGFPRCGYPEDLYIDDVPKLHVASAAAVGPGKWYFDYGADTIIIGDNPAGKKVEVGVTPFAFTGSVSNVTIKNMTIEKYATPVQFGVIDASEASNWTISNNIIQLNHSMGLDFGPSNKVIGNKINKNGMAGYGGGGPNFLVQGNEVGHNGYAGINFLWEGGGGKITDSTGGGVVVGNCVHNNAGPGIWEDVDANGIVIENNVVFNNSDNGIMYEISYNGIIRNNTVFDNGSANAGWLWNPQILVSSSRGVKVYGNKVDVPAAYGNAVTIISQERAPYTPAINNEIHDNDVTMRGANATMGAACDWDPDMTAVANQNKMFNNTYHVANLANESWEWADRSYTLAAIKATGVEAGSIVNTALPAKPAANCNFLDFPDPPPPPPSDTTAPTVPVSLNATATSSSEIHLAWNPSTDNIGVTGYKVFRGTTQIGTSATTSFTATGLAASTAYSFTVSAYDAAGNESAKSASDSATTLTTPDTTAPSVPANLNATAVSVSRINLTWNASTDNVGVTGYKVFRNNVQVGTAIDTSYADTGLEESTTYTYTVLAHDATGNESAKSASDSATTLTPADTAAPSVPANLNATAVSVSRINLTWNASTDNVAVTGYKIFRNNVEVGTATGTSYADTGLAASTTYTYTVSAYDAAGNNSAKSASETATTLTPADTLAPSVPANLNATAVSATRINLTWNPSIDAVGVTGYKIFRNNVQVGTATGTSYADTALTASTTYTYTVSSYDAAGNNSGKSVADSATTPAAPDTTAPSVPANLNATATSTTQINLTWNVSTDAVGVTGYKIFRNNTQVGTATGTSYSDSGLTASTTYTYTVSAYDAAGNNSAKSASDSATTQAEQPGQFTTTIKIKASGDQFRGAPNMRVYLDKALLGVVSVTADHDRGQSETYTYTMKTTTAPEFLTVAFTNDLFAGRDRDRNLYILSVTVNGVNYDPRNATLRELNGRLSRERAGNVLWTNGALVFKLNSN